MLSYEIYKVIHLGAIFIFLGTMAMAFSTKIPQKSMQIFGGVAGLLILVAGMGMMARLGIKHGDQWPTWLKLKLGIWLALSIFAPILAKRLQFFRKSFYYIFVVGLSLTAVYIVINQAHFA